MFLFLKRLPLVLSFPTLAVLAFSVLSVRNATAQETRGTIFGTVKDPSGGVLAGMSVIATNE
jgi:hypothetical protein